MGNDIAGGGTGIDIKGTTPNNTIVVGNNLKNMTTAFSDGGINTQLGLNIT